MYHQLITRIWTVSGKPSEYRLRCGRRLRCCGRRRSGLIRPSRTPSGACNGTSRGRVCWNNENETYGDERTRFTQELTLTYYVRCVSRWKSGRVISQLLRQDMTGDCFWVSFFRDGRRLLATCLFDVFFADVVTFCWIIFCIFVWILFLLLII